MNITKSSLASNRPRQQQQQQQQYLLSCGSLAVVVIVLLLSTTIWYNFEVWQQQYGTSVTVQQAHENRCNDPDDPVAWKKIPQKRHCLCPDPTIATKELRNDQPEWMEHHQVLCNDLHYELSLQQEQQPPLDIVFLGDSIIERWNGTRSMGTKTNYTEFRDSFDSMFHKRRADSPAQLQGLLLGTSGDTTTELLWHMENMAVVHSTQYSVELKVIFVLIGTNDLGRLECSKHTTLQGIMTILNNTSRELPTKHIIVHGLLPRSDTYNEGDYSLGRYWQDIVYINAELERMCRESPKQLWHYMDASHIFLTNRSASGTMMINQTLMSDSLHPDLMGYNIWGQEIVQKVLQIIS